MKQFRKYGVGMLLLVTLLSVTACGGSDRETGDQNGAGTSADENMGGGTSGENIKVEDILFDTDGDGVYDSADVDGDGLLEEIGRDANDVVEDLVNDVTGEDAMVDGETGDAAVDGNMENGNGDVLP